jgi:hypothetical protein
MTMTIQIEWQDLVDGKVLPDNDIIRVGVTGGITPNMIEIKLQLSGVTWWKGLQASEIVLCQAQDTQTISSATMNYQDFSNRTFTIWKAKTFGVHTPMYTVNDQNSFMQAGNSYWFVWSQD